MNGLSSMTGNSHYWSEFLLDHIDLLL